MSSFIAKGYFSYHWILWLAFGILIIDMTAGFIILPFYKGAVIYIEKGDLETPKKFLSSYLIDEQVDV